MRAPTFYQKCRDQQLYITQLTGELDDYNNKMRSLHMSRGGVKPKHDQNSATTGATGKLLYYSMT